MEGWEEALATERLLSEVWAVPVRSLKGISDHHLTAYEVYDMVTSGTMQVRLLQAFKQCYFIAATVVKDC